MPNWCFNSMTIDKKYKNKIVNDKEEVDFNIMVPMPESLHVTAGGTNDSDMYVYISDKLTKSLDEVRKDEHSKLIENMFDKDWIKTVFERTQADPDLKDAKKMEEAYQRGSVLISNFDNYGSINWYDWAIANWGTKWNGGEADIDEDPNDDEILIRFDTAWSPPYLWLEALAQNKIPFELEWEEEGGERGRITGSENGEISEEELDPVEWDEDDENE